MIIKRDFYLNKLIASQGNGLVKVITGIRRAGKSFLLFNLFRSYLLEQGVDKEHIIEMEFDDFENKDYRNPDTFCAFVKGRLNDNGKYYLLLDEVQQLNNFEDVLNGLVRKPNVEVFVTGSNAKFLSKDIITEFRGRGDQIHIYPLSFAEFMSVYNGGKEDGWQQYITFGGIPMVVKEPSPDRKIEMLKNLLDETYIADILTRNKIKNTTELEDLLNILASNIGSPTNPQRLSDTFKSVLKSSITPPTIKLYIDYFRDSFLLERAQRYDVKGRKYIGTPNKYYFMDLGLRNARLNFRQPEASHLMENAVYNELRRRGFSVDVGIVAVNSQNSQGRNVRKQLEVDFVCNKGSKRYYIQSVLNMDSEEKREQELNSFKHIGDNFKKIVVTGGHILPYQDENGVAYINIYDFLLNEDSLTL